MYNNVLSINAACGDCSVAISSFGAIKSLHKDDRKNMQSAVLANLINLAMKQAQIKISEIDCIITTVGPGSFTGIKIGIAIASGISSGVKQNLPILYFNTLSLLHWLVISNELNTQSDYTHTINAGRGRFFCKRTKYNDALKEKSDDLWLVEANLINEFGRDSIIYGEYHEKHHKMYKSICALDILQRYLALEVSQYELYKNLEPIYNLKYWSKC
ncbi:MAG: tRNA (adenosine(37)-N6)-threonylcarbamoyltransferase complex dimerization subunit type 1 TsaB [Proteobacteria bacterium]|nr:tRNA (adenosine(37)-N6)-threonylcarbamoyltransferase complex dimerization subunit type 1 TsaB [Pseudomonadota bacterium]